MATIPKHMMFFWANDKMSWMRYMTLYSFKKLNPDWKITLFLSKPNDITTKTWPSSEKQDFHNFSGQDLFSKIENLGIDIRTWEFEDREKVTSDVMGASHKSNFFKWQWMAKEGGFYSDLDILFIKPFEGFYQKCKNFNTVICHHRYFSIGLLGSSGNNEFFDDIYNYTYENYSSGKYQSAGVLSVYSWLENLNGKKLIKWGRHFNFATNYYKNMSFYNIPMDVVYPWTSTKMGSVFERDVPVPKNCIGIHWYAGSRISQKYNNIINEENFQTFKNTFCHFAKKVIEKGG